MWISCSSARVKIGKMKLNKGIEEGKLNRVNMERSKVTQNTEILKTADYPTNQTLHHHATHCPLGAIPLKMHTLDLRAVPS